jgi:GH25 family lysozyme M1 (1,4-beta-N-acetylmuramidase)
MRQIGERRQVAASGVPGISGPVDRNSFNGTRAGWKRALEDRYYATR